MGRRRNRNAEPDEPERGFLEERGRRWAAGLLFGAVVAILLFATFVRTDSPYGDPAAGVAAIDVDAEAHETEPVAVPEEAPEVAAETEIADDPVGPTGAVSLAARVMEDRERIASAGGQYTVQLMVACSPETVHNILAHDGGSGDLYVLPTVHQGRSCYLLSWGVYPTREAAEGARLPGALRGAVSETFVRQITDLIS
jgi:septal ring-binding cell division protein DamX